MSTMLPILVLSVCCQNRLVFLYSRAAQLRQKNNILHMRIFSAHLPRFRTLGQPFPSIYVGSASCWTYTRLAVFLTTILTTRDLRSLEAG